MDTSMHQIFAEMAKQELEEVLSVMPSDPMQKFVIFIETVRVLDYWSVFQNLLPKENRLSGPDFNLIQWGWNLATEYLYTAIRVPGAFPISESTKESRLFAVNLLHKLGRSVLLYRASEMIRIGSLEVESNEEGFTVRMTDTAKYQFLDDLEFFHLDEMEMELGSNNSEYYKSWEIFDADNYPIIENALGNFASRPPKRNFENQNLKNIDELMVPLIHPWDSGHGIMMGYETRPEIDNHFFAEALEEVIRWRVEAGLHPDADFGDISGADITLITNFIIALHLKHIRFALLAIKHYPEISIPQSLTIWGALDELENSIVEYSNLDRALVKKALDMITMRPDEASRLHKVTKYFVPLLMSLGNGLVLYPVSSIFRNPFLSTIILQGWRSPISKEQIFKHRESWMRSEIYQIFQGTRYKRVDGNINIRDENKVLTDIDGAIFDKLTGELALFQIKWQDYFTNDIREMRSKASNLTKELDEWAIKVESWIKKKGMIELIKTLRLKLRNEKPISSVYLFGISRFYARTQGFGFATKSQNLAIANWPQFLRVRYEIGPADRVFHKLFETLRQKMNEEIPNPKPLPITISVAGKSICFENIWNGFGDEDEQGA